MHLLVVSARGGDGDDALPASQLRLLRGQHGEDAVQRQLGGDRVGVARVGQRVAPGEVAGDVPVIVSLLFVLRLDHYEPVDHLHGQLLGREVLDVQGDLEALAIQLEDGTEVLGGDGHATPGAGLVRHRIHPVVAPRVQLVRTESHEPTLHVMFSRGRVIHHRSDYFEWGDRGEIKNQNKNERSREIQEKLCATDPASGSYIVCVESAISCLIDDTDRYSNAGVINFSTLCLDWFQ